MSRARRRIDRFAGGIELEAGAIDAMARALETVGNDDVYDDFARGMAAAYRDAWNRLSKHLAELDVEADEP